MRSLVWFRSDLRVRDNTALYHACREADAGVVGVFLVAAWQWREHDWAGCKVEFVLRNLRELFGELGRLNIPLIVARADRFQDAPRELLRLARAGRCGSIHFNREYEVNESRRDEAVEAELTRAGLRVRSYHDQLVLAPGEVRTKDDRFFTVFTPFRRAWIARLKETGAGATLPAPRKQPRIDVRGVAAPEGIAGFESRVRESLWPAGEKRALARLARFAERRIERYKKDRDAPGEDGTSRLSPSLTMGVVSARHCLAAARDANKGRLDGGAAGPGQWITELIWRDFYKHVLVGFPRVCMGRAFKPETDRLRWRYDEADFDAWRRGRTGVPIVDAAMRQLLAEGWMHNRLRMISAMYLSKDLLIDWRWGEKHFMEHLIDGDLAANNGGWQWSASTGTDAAPYFRIFNPVSQSRAHDPAGAFIRKYVPELAGLDDAEIHEPTAAARAELGYPAPIVDHAAARERVMREFRRVRR